MTKHRRTRIARLLSWLAVAGLALMTTAKAQPGGLKGTWSGEYTCNQGLTGVTLTITRGEPDDVQALFHFYEAPSNRGVPDGCFEMAGRFDPASGELRLEGGRWLLRPRGYIVVDFIGRLEAASGRFDGRVEGYNCTTFRLTRRPSPLPVPKECRPRDDTVVMLAPNRNSLPSPVAGEGGSAKH